MSYLKIDPTNIKLAGAGAKLQWGMIIGVAVDKIVGDKAQIADEHELLTEIRGQLGRPGLAAKVPDPSKLSDVERHTIDHILKGTGTKLTTKDLHKVFSSHRAP